MTWDILETREKVPKKISAPAISREGSEKNLRTYDTRSHLQKDSFRHIISGTSGAQTSTVRVRVQGAHHSSKKKKKIGEIRLLATSELLYATPFFPIVSFPNLFYPVEILPYFCC